MIQSCIFDKTKDFEEVIPDLSISIQMALTTGIIKDTATDMSYNKMESTDEVGHYLSDAIDIAMEQRRVTGILNSQLASNEANFNTNPE